MDRTNIYYWKCDRAAAFHGTSDYLCDQHELHELLAGALVRRFGGDLTDLALGCGQGNHRTFTATLKGEKVFIRTEDGVDSMLYPPNGRRGYSRSVRAFGYGTVLPEVPPKPLLFAQIETLEAVGNVDAIAAVEGVDVLFVGPADLAFDLRARGSEKTLDELLPVVADAAKRAGKAAGILTRDDAEVAKRLALGYTHQAVDSDLGILRRRWKELTTR